MLFVEYPKCSTCRKAKAWLDARGADYEDRHIGEARPTEAELRTWWAASGLPLRRFFNTSGLRYRELGLSDRLPAMSDAEMLALLATDGMLVKRPILVLGDPAAPDAVLVGFREPDWAAALE